MRKENIKWVKLLRKWKGLRNNISGEEKKILKPFRDFILKNKKLSPDERTGCYNTAKCRAELKKLNEWYADVGMLSQIK